MPRKKSIKDIADDVVGLVREEDDVFKDPLFSKDQVPPHIPLDRAASAVTKPVLIDGHDVTRGAIPRDPLKLKLRLYIQIGELLHALETGQGDDGPVTMRERIAALTSIGRLQALLIDKSKDDDENAGSAIRKYEGAFKNGAGKRKKVARSPAGDKLLLEPDRDGDELDGDSSGDAYNS